MLRLLVDNNNGAVFVMTLVMVSLLAILGATFISIVTFEMRNANWQLRRVQAFYLAEAALNKGIVLVRNDEDWSMGGDGSATDNFPGEGVWYYLYDGIADANNVPLGDGTYSVQLLNPLGSGGNAIDMRATATIGEINRTIQIRMLLSTLPGSSVFAWAIFGSVSLEMKGNNSTDSYNSDGEPTSGDNGHIGSNGDITLRGGCEIGGNATPGPDDEIIYHGSGNTVTGSTEPASELVDLPLLEIEDFSDSENLTGSRTLEEGTYYFTNIVLAGQSELLINGDVTIYCQSASFGGGSHITVSDGSKLTLYCRGDYSDAGSGINNENGKPENFILYCAGDVGLGGSQPFYGAVYANGNVNVGGNRDYYGAIVAMGEVVIHGGSDIHYDEALADVVDVVSIGEEQQVTTASWHEGY